MDKFDEESDEIIEQKITKVNGEIGSKKYLKGKLLGKGSISVRCRWVRQVLRRHQYRNQAEVRHENHR